VKAAVGAGAGAAGVGGALAGGWLAVAALALPVAAALALLAWVLADCGRTQRMADLIQAARAPQSPEIPPAPDLARRP